MIVGEFRSKLSSPRSSCSLTINAMCFRKPWLRVESVNFDFSGKSSSTNYNESNKPTRSL